jgi:GDP-L-fucose synthase
MPTNLYGPNDNFDLNSSHVLPALMRKFHDAKMDPAKRPVILWGSGSPFREFLHVDDLADACVFLMSNYSGDDIVNIGIGEDITIKALADLVRKVVGYEGEVVWDHAKPDGTHRKLLDVTKLRELGWKPTIALEEGIRQTYQWYLENVV